MAQNDTHVALIILTTQMWGEGEIIGGKNFFGPPSAGVHVTPPPQINFQVALLCGKKVIDCTHQPRFCCVGVVERVCTWVWQPGEGLMDHQRILVRSAEHSHVQCPHLSGPFLEIAATFCVLSRIPLC